MKPFLTEALPLSLREFAVGICSLVSTRAAVRTWDGGAADGTWMNATNWAGDVAPSAGDDLVFPAGAAQLTCNNNFPAGTTFNSIIIGAPYDFTGHSIALNAGILATNGNATYIETSLILNSNQTFTLNVGSASFNLIGAIDNNGNDLTVSVGSGTLAQVQSVISGGGGLIKTGSGSALLYASNTFSGPVQINQGAVNVYHGHALGDTNGNTTIAGGAVLVFANSITVSEPIALSGILRSAGVGQVLTGPLSLAASGAEVDVVSGSSLTINSMISGAFGLLKGLAGALILNANNTYTGPTHRHRRDSYGQRLATGHSDRSGSRLAIGHGRSGLGYL
jgi:fibronectin-binding autotransporter adhesin